MNAQARPADRKVIGVSLVALLSASLLAPQQPKPTHTANPVPAVPSTEPMAITPPIGPPGMSFAGQATARIVRCPTPTITSMSPDIWVAGKTYKDVILTGTDFTTSKEATTACPATTVTVTSGSEKVKLSSFEVVGETQITIAVASMADDRNESATVTVGTSPHSATTTAQIRGCQLPTSEKTAPNGNGWDSDNPTIGLWKQSITNPSDIAFSGVSIQEFNAGNSDSAVDTCHFKDSKWPAFYMLSWGDPWTVNPDNTWGDDHVGWSASLVAYYRAQGRAPCGTSMRQQMAMACLNDDGTYSYDHNYGPVNILQDGFTLTTVTSGRAGQSETKEFK